MDTAPGNTRPYIREKKRQSKKITWGMFEQDWLNFIWFSCDARWIRCSYVKKVLVVTATVIVLILDYHHMTRLKPSKIWFILTKDTTTNPLSSYSNLFTLIFLSIQLYTTVTVFLVHTLTLTYKRLNSSSVDDRWAQARNLFYVFHRSWWDVTEK